MAAQEEAKAAATRRRRRGHPLLRGCSRRERYTHGLHPAQMEALRAMCGALIPPLPPVTERLHGDSSDGGSGKDLERFYLASAADGTIPEEVAELVTRCVWEAVVLMNVVLWILSTKVGTLALCGRLCISGGKFPYVRKFADMPVERREQALTRWNKTRWLFPLKITFGIIKILSNYAFYTTAAAYLGHHDLRLQRWAPGPTAPRMGTTTYQGHQRRRSNSRLQQVRGKGANARA